MSRSLRTFIEDYGVIAFATLILLATYIRLFFSVDFLDESGYVGIPYTFALGAKPFFDEVATTQNTGVLLLPFYKLYTLIFTDADALVLSVRHIYFAMSLFSAWCTYSFATNFLRRDLSLLISSLPVAFIFFSVPSPSYNTVGSLGLLIGFTTFLNLLLVRKKPISLSIIGTSFFAAATYGYPTLVVIAGPAILFTLLRVKKNFPLGSRKPVYIAILASSGVWLAFALGTIQYAGLDNILKPIGYYKMFGNNFGGMEKFNWIYDSLAENIFYLYAVLAGLCAILAGQLKYKWFHFLCIPVVPVLLYFAWQAPNLPNSPINLIVFLGMLPLVFIFWKNRAQSLEIKFFWFMSFLSSLVFAWTSSNGLPNASLGMLTSSVLNLIVLGGFLEKDRIKTSGIAAFKFVVAAYISVVMLLCFRYVYPSNHIMNMTSLVTSGTYMGLFTMPDRNKFISEVTADINSRRPSAKSIIFFNDFPAGYLFTNLQRHSQSHWTPSGAITPNFPEDRVKNVLGYYDSESKLPDLAVYMIPLRRNEKGEIVAVKVDDPVLNFFSSPPYRAVIVRPSYVIFQK